MQDARDSENAEMPDRQNWTRIRQAIQNGDQHKHVDILNVVQMASAHSFHIRIIELHFRFIAEILAVFRV